MPSTSEPRLFLDKGRQPFDAVGTRVVLDEACSQLQLNGADASLVRLGENAIYQLPRERVVARIARRGDACQKEVEVARWLAQQDFPAVRLVEKLPQLCRFGGHVVTWWELIEEGPEPPQFIDFAEILRELHELPAPSFALPTFVPMRRVSQRLKHAPTQIRAEDKQFLEWLHEHFEQDYGGLRFELAPGPIHGDAHIGNLMRGRDGVVRLIDFERFARGPREWDVSVLAAAHQRFGWMDAAEYQRCVEIYGWDPTSWSGYPTLRAVRELNMTTWLMQRAGESGEVDAEIATRLADLRSGTSARRWHQF